MSGFGWWIRGATGYWHWMRWLRFAKLLSPLVFTVALFSAGEVSFSGRQVVQKLMVLCKNDAAGRKRKNYF